MRGFSLVELSIVLVILGLLVGGILTGQCLIRAAELRSVVADYQRFTSAAQTFRDKYMAIPGDMNNATRFWLRQVSATHCVTNSSAAVGTPGTCDGNGDGVVAWGGAASESGETFQFWRQLALAGMIEGNHTGFAGSGGARDARPNINVPAGKISNSGYSVEPQGIIGPGDTWRWPADYGNVLYAGGNRNSSHPTELPLFRPEEAWNVDVKLDDGVPTTGRVMSHRKSSLWINCTTTNVETTSQYNLIDTSIACVLLFPKAF